MTGGPRRFMALAAVAIFAAGSLAGCVSSGDADDLAAAFVADVGADGQTVTFDATTSTGPIQEYEWAFGDGTTGDGPVIEKTYAATDTTVFASLLVTGASGEVATTYQNVTLGDGANQAPQVSLSAVNRWVPPDQAVRLAANVSDPDGDDVNVTWIFGPLPPEEPPEARFATGGLGPGDESEGRFDLEGVYLIESEEHEWMRTRLVVAGAQDAPDNVTVAIRNHAIHGGATVHLAPGGTVRFVNEDPVNRSVRVAYAALGAEAGSEATFTTPALASGSYQATLVMEDGKGGLTLRSWGVRASTDAPVLPDASYDGQNIVQQGEHLHHGFPGDVLFPAHVWANATWEAAPVPAPVVHLAIAVRGTEQLVGPEGTCDAERCSLTGILAPGSYDWEIEFEAGVFDSYQIQTSYYVFGMPEGGHAAWSQAHGHGWGG